MGVLSCVHAHLGVCVMRIIPPPPVWSKIKLVVKEEMSVEAIVDDSLMMADIQ